MNGRIFRSQKSTNKYIVFNSLVRMCQANLLTFLTLVKLYTLT